MKTEQALIDTGINTDEIVTLGEFEKNYKYQITFATYGMAEHFASSFPQLRITTPSATVHYPVPAFVRREFRIKVSWFPDAGDSADITLALSQYGEVLHIFKEKIQSLFSKYFSGNRIVTMVPDGDMDDVPDFLNMCTHDEVFTTRLTVLGMTLRGHNCCRRGHMPHDCTACGWCGSSAHITSDHPEGIPMTNFADRVRDNSRPAPGRPGTALVTKVPQGGRAQSRSSVNSAPTKSSMSTAKITVPDKTAQASTSAAKNLTTDSAEQWQSIKNRKRRHRFNGSKSEVEVPSSDDDSSPEVGVKTIHTKQKPRLESSPPSSEVGDKPTFREPNGSGEMS